MEPGNYSRDVNGRRNPGEGRGRGGGNPGEGRGRGWAGGCRGGAHQQLPEQGNNQAWGSGLVRDQGRGAPYSGQIQDHGHGSGGSNAAWVQLHQQRGGGNSAWVRPPPQQHQQRGGGGRGTGLARPTQQRVDLEHTGSGAPNVSPMGAPSGSSPPPPHSLDSVEQERGKTISASNKALKILTYNVWFADIEMPKRMKALGDLIVLHSPDVISLQEVTPVIYDIFQHSSWWKMYSCSVSNVMELTRGYFCMQLSKLAVKSYSCKPFRNSIMGRELCIAEIEIQKGTTLVVATSHLESPCPSPPKWDQMFSKERVEQAKEAVKLLERKPNVVFCGDMNWDDELDGQFPLPDGWADAWSKMKPNEIGYTYDTKSNKMLSANRWLQKRLDRFVCKLQDFAIRDITMIGKDAIPNVTYIKEKKVKSDVRKLILPVLPSDHYGLLLEISPQ